MGKKIPVIGVAKTRFAGVNVAQEIKRGGSDAPLFITAAGVSLERAADYIKAMRGPFRLPALLKRVDQLCRGIV
jgi:deoxyribonuclease V